MQFLPEKPSLDRIHCSSLWPSRSNSSTGAFSTYRRGGHHEKWLNIIPVDVSWLCIRVTGQQRSHLFLQLCVLLYQPTRSFHICRKLLLGQKLLQHTVETVWLCSSFNHVKLPISQSTINISAHPPMPHLQVLQSGQQVNGVGHELLQRDSQLHPFFMVVVQRAFEVVRQLGGVHQFGQTFDWHHAGLVHKQKYKRNI